MKQENKKYWIMILILGLLFIFSLMMSAILGSGEAVIDYNTAVIPINGEITADSSSGWFSDSTAGAAETVQLIKKARNDPKVKAIIFEINSPGGSPVATDEISQEIKSLKNDNITTVAWVREVGASGAYWIASSTDHIVANRMSVVGSIGVFGSYIDWSGLMDIYNVSYERLVSGEFKDTGIPYRNLTETERIYLQDKLDTLHEYFISAVAENRHMNYSDVKVLADGKIFLGGEAVKNGLIDELGGEQEALNYVESVIGETPAVKEFSQQKSFFEALASAMNKNSFYMGEGIGSQMVKASGFRITT